MPLNRFLLCSSVLSSRNAKLARHVRDPRAPRRSRRCVNHWRGSTRTSSVPPSRGREVGRDRRDDALLADRVARPGCDGSPSCMPRFPALIVTLAAERVRLVAVLARRCRRARATTGRVVGDRVDVAAGEPDLADAGQVGGAVARGRGTAAGPARAGSTSTPLADLGRVVQPRQDAAVVLRARGRARCAAGRARRCGASRVRERHVVAGAGVELERLPARVGRAGGGGVERDERAAGGADAAGERGASAATSAHHRRHLQA